MNNRVFHWKVTKEMNFKSVHNKDTYTVYLNKELVKCEYEAYRRQYENYKDVMSEYLKLDTKIGLERNKNYYEQIKDK